MTGSLQIKAKKWYVVVRMLDSDGKGKYKWFPTDIDAGSNDKAKAKHKREAENRKNEIVAELNQQKVVYSADILFLDWIDKWMASKKLDVYQSTYEGYELIVDAHIRPYFSPLKLTLNTITPQNIKDYYDAKRGTGLSVNTVKHHRVILNSAMEQAVDFNIVPYNVVSRVKLPKITRVRQNQAAKAGRLRKYSEGFLGKNE